MNDKLEPLVKSLGANYDNSTQIMDIFGYEKGTNNFSGESLIYLVAYDKKRESKNERSIIQVLPILLYLPSLPTSDILPDSWTQEYIERVIDKHLHWSSYPNTSKEKQFYKRFISGAKRNPNLAVRALSAHFPIEKSFFNSLEWLRIRIYDRLSLIYKRKGEETIHLADGYIVCSSLPDTPSDDNIIDEFITSIFVSDEDTMAIYPNTTSLGKLSLIVPSDSQYNITALSKNTESKFKSRRVQYEGYCLETMEYMKIDEVAEYRGNSMGFNASFLNSLTTLNRVEEDGTKTYIAEITNPNTHIINTPSSQVKAYIIGQSYLPYDQTSLLSPNNLVHSPVVSLPYFNNHITKLFPIKLHNSQYLRLDVGDYINPRV